MTLIEPISTDQAPLPAGHYVQALGYRELVFVSGQLGLRPNGEHTFEQPFEDQARQAIANLLKILDAAGSAPDRVLKITAYIVGVENWPVFNRVYADAFGKARPARSIVPVPNLHYGYLVELDAIAVRVDRHT
jgi:2-iminobutanoate/2-iminopropanoate deaminase